MTGTVEQPACMEPGRAMLHRYVGRWFARTPERERAQEGSACSRCGLVGAPLWISDGFGTRSCAAQLAITAKRPGRKLETDPEPGPGENGKFSMGDGAFALAGPGVAMLISRLSPVAPPPPGLEVRFAEVGAIRTAVADLRRSPPPLPFVAVLFAQKAGYPIEVSTHPSRIVLNGPNGFVSERPTISDAMRIAARIGPARALELAKLRERLASENGSAAQREKDREAFEAMIGEGSVSMADFRRLPVPGSEAARAMAGAGGDAHVPGGDVQGDAGVVGTTGEGEAG